MTQDKTATYEDAVAMVIRDQRPSPSYLQRRLQVGWATASEWIGFMEREGICGPPNSAGRREMLRAPEEPSQ